jgi:hypothetical protein
MQRKAEQGAPGINTANPPYWNRKLTNSSAVWSAP